MIVTLGENNYAETVEKANALILLDAWASWCQPCKAIEPLVAEIAKNYEGKVVVAKLNVDEEPALAQRMGVTALPTLRILDRGVVRFESLGVVDRARLTGAVEAALKAGVA
jgi:thioredoxin 1